VSVVVADTGPLNYLILIGEIDLLPALFDSVIVPPSVIAELRHPHAPDPVAQWVRSLPEWIHLHAPESVLEIALGAGERDAISVARELGVHAILLDDRKARLEALRHEIRVIGTLAILELADEAGLLDFSHTIRRLLETSFHVEAPLVEAIQARIEQRKQSGP
jgi:predicted nucleic acid-binding protein